MIIRKIITIAIFSNLIGALSASFFTNYCVGLKSDGEIAQVGCNWIPELAQLHQPVSALSLIHQSHHLSQ